jgi:hypothetical protein
MWPSEASFGGIDLSGYRVDAERKVFNGVPCLVLRASDPRTVETEVWVDPARDDIIVRVVGKIALQVARQIDIRYQNLQSVGWVLESWQMSINRPGTNDISFRCDGELRDVSILPELDAALFDIDFPPQSTVYDVSASSREHVKQYVVASDGRLQLVERGGVRSSPRRAIIVAGTATLVVVLLVIIVIRRYQARLPTTGTTH